MNLRPSSALLLTVLAASGPACRRRAPEPDRISITESIPATGCPPLPPIAGFIGLREGALVTEWLTPYRATGSNVYYLQQLFTYAQQDGDAKLSNAVTEVLDDLVCLSLPVARLWGFNDGSDRSTIRNGPHDFRESGLRGLDQAIWEAKRRGIRVIIPLVNNWADYGGLTAYASWASKEDGVVHTHDDFFHDARLRQWWKDYVTMLAARVNTFTGVAYRDEPAILAWEVGNELRCSTCRGTTHYVDTVRELAAFLRYEFPRHLIADGGEGFDDDPDAYAGLSNDYPVRGDEGTSFSKLATLGELDLLSYHYYPRSYGLVSAGDTRLWISRHQAIGAVYGKVAYLGECGTVEPDAERAVRYDAWLSHLFDESGGPLGLMWQLLPDVRQPNDEFSVYTHRDRATAWILSRWGALLR
jgi:mannan endo-1,4-beta-mannosidase